MPKPLNLFHPTLLLLTVVTCLVVVHAARGQAANPLAQIGHVSGDDDIVVDEGAIDGSEFEVEPTDSQQQTIQLALAALASPQARTRTQGYETLVELSLPACNALRQAYHQSDDHEFRLLVERALRKIYLNHYVFERHAFLGVSQKAVTLSPHDDPRVPASGVGIWVDAVIPGTAAEVGGLLEWDCIISVDGAPIVGGPSGFGEKIRAMAPGTEVVLTVIRNEEVVELNIVLGKRPERYYTRGGVELGELRTARRNFRVWYRQYLVDRNAIKPNAAAPAEDSNTVDGGAAGGTKPAPTPAEEASTDHPAPAHQPTPASQ